MAEKITVPRSEVLELLGLQADTDDATMHKALSDAAALIEAKERDQVAAAEEQRLRAEDRRLVNAAYNEGRILHRDKWVAHLADNRRQNRALLAALAPCLPPEQKVAVDEGLETTHRHVMARLGIQSPPATPRTVAAAADNPSYRPSIYDTSGTLVEAASAADNARDRAVFDVLGQKLPPAVPDPVLVRKGVNVADYTPEQHYNRFLRMLGGKFAAAAQPAPPGDLYYYPSPNDHVELVDGKWVEKNPYREA